MGMRDAVFPLYLRAKGDKEIWELESLDHLQGWVEVIDVENSEYEGWDSLGFPIILQVEEGNSITAKSTGESSAREEVLRAFNDFAITEGVPFKKPQQPYDLHKTYEGLKDAVEKARSRKPWWQKVLRRL